MEGTNLGIEDRIPIAAAIVIIDYAYEVAMLPSCM